MNNIAISANDINTNQALYLFIWKNKQKTLKKNLSIKITWIDSELTKRFFKLEKKLLTYKHIYRLRQVMKSILLELAIQYYTDKYKNIKQN